MKARFLLLIVLGILCLIPVKPSRADSTATISVDPPNIQVPQNQIGTTFQVGINVTNVSSLWRWVISIQWNPQVLNLTGIIEGSFLKSAGSTMFASAADNLTAIESGFLSEATCVLLSASGATGSGVLATLTFRALARGTSSITLNVLALSTYQSGGLKEIPYHVINGNLVVIPEFPGWLLPIILFTSAAALSALKKKRLLRA